MKNIYEISIEKKNKKEIVGVMYTSFVMLKGKSYFTKTIFVTSFYFSNYTLDGFDL